MKMAKQSIAAWINSGTYKKVEQFQKSMKIPTKSQALDIILSDYFNSTGNRAHKEPKECSKTNCRMILYQLSDITAKMNEFEQNLKKEMIKK